MSVLKLGSNKLEYLDVKLGSILLTNKRQFTGKLNIPTGIYFPVNAYYLEPNINGNFTKAMVDSAIANGETYIVFDAENLEVHYEESPHLVDSNTWGVYLQFEGIKGTEESPITLDFRKVNINCYPNAIDELFAHCLFYFKNCENIILKLGNVEGDKFKRPLDSDDETVLENTAAVRSDAGTINLIVDGGNVAGFMADVEMSSPFGSAAIDASPLALDYYLQGDGRYESRFYNIDPTLYATFGLTGGLGYNRLLYYDMEDVTFKFYDASEVFISEITGAQYYGTYTFPVTARKMKVNVRHMDGRIESPTNFGHMLQYNPNSGTVVKNMRISDNHRGGIANIGANAIIENNRFLNTSRYFSVPEFGVIGNPSSTRYHINCEDVVSRNLTIRNNIFTDKFHKLLLTHNINADITNNTFTGSGNNIFIYDLINGTISGNNFNNVVNGGQGTNKNQVTVSGNTGNAIVQLTNGANWVNNNFANGDLSGKGKASGNTFTNFDYSYFNWTKEITSNTFIGNSGDVTYTIGNAYIYQNTFNNTYFRFQHSGNPIYFDGVTIDNTSNASLVGFDRTTGDNTIVAVNSTFNNLRIANGNAASSWYFYNCTFNNVSDYIFKLLATTTNPVQFYFKDCTFVGSGNFRSTASVNTNYNVTFDNCTIDSNIVLPANYTNATVTIPALVEPRTQPIPNIWYDTDHVNIDTDFHIFTLKIRNKNTLEIVLDKDVCSAYNHFTATPNDFEYSIDGGVYWDSISI